jgi:hypothetical protein
MGLHVLQCNMNIFKKSVNNMGIRLYMKIAVSINKSENCKTFKRQ